MRKSRAATKRSSTLINAYALCSGFEPEAVEQRARSSAERATSVADADICCVAADVCWVDADACWVVAEECAAISATVSMSR